MAIRDIEREMDRFFEKVKEQLHRVNKATGETFAGNAKRTNTYRDRTANLRNSIGYSAIAPDRRQESANVHAKQAISEVENEVVDHGLILVAGMNYAPYVEAKGYDVISNSVETAKVQHKRLLEQMLKI